MKGGGNERGKGFKVVPSGGYAEGESGGKTRKATKGRGWF